MAALLARYVQMVIWLRVKARLPRETAIASNKIFFILISLFDIYEYYSYIVICILNFVKFLYDITTYWTLGPFINLPSLIPLTLRVELPLAKIRKGGVSFDTEWVKRGEYLYS